MLQIGGRLSKRDYPVGLARGADATFHRILVSGVHNRLILTPVSFITVNTVKEALPDNISCTLPKEAIPSCSISDLLQSGTCKMRSLRCRVVGVHIVLMEKNKILDKLMCGIPSGVSTVNIPLAGFILDDGSSRCCCWANGARAVTFLRLHEEVPQAGYGGSCWRLQDKGKFRSTTICYVDKILKRHGKLTLKNLGSTHDSLGQEFYVSVGSNCGTEDENLLKLMMFSVCSGTIWSVIGHVMDSNSVNVLEKYLLEEQLTSHSLQYVWAKEVCEVNTLAEARALFQEF